MARGATAAAVLLAHFAALAPAFFPEPGGRRGTGRATSTSMEVLLLPSAPRSAPPAPVPTLIRIRSRLPPPPTLVAATQGTLDQEYVSANPPSPRPSSPPFERLIVEAKPEDAKALHEFCSGSFPPVSRMPNEQGTVVLLVRIESDGHVSDTTVEESSGSPRLDRVTQACVAAGSFEPARTGWRSVPSWQRIHWNWSNP
jgi:TonB family protein